MGIGEVRIGVSATEIGEGLAVHDGFLRKSKLVDKDLLTIGTGDTMHAIEEDGKLGGLLQKALDEVKVKDVLEEDEIISN